MRRLFIPLAMATVLAGCAEVQTAVDTTARNGAKGVVSEVLVTRFPQVPKQLITPFTDCVIENATAAEVRGFIRAATVGVDAATVEAVRSIVPRPGTTACLRGRAGTLAL